MVAEVLEAIGASAPALTLRYSFWIYPLINAGHILGIGLLIGAIVPLDLRLMGFFRAYSLRPLARVLVPTAAFGLALAAVTGSLLFIVKPLEYAASDIFVVKLAVIGAGLINVAAVRANPRWPEITEGGQSLLDETEPDPHLKMAGAISLGIWIGVLVLGRMVGYFM